MQLVYKERQINNLKAKVLHLEKEIEVLTNKNK
jgi:hypothetical protein